MKYSVQGYTTISVNVKVEAESKEEALEYVEDNGLDLSDFVGGNGTMVGSVNENVSVDIGSEEFMYDDGLSIDDIVVEV